MGEYLYMTAFRLPDDSKTVEIAGQRPIYTVTFSHNGRLVVSGGAEGMIRRWRVDDGQEVVHAIRAEGAEIFAVDLSADNRWLVCGLRRSGVGDRKAAVQVWDAETHKKVLDIHGHKDTVFSVGISPDSTKFAAGSADKHAFIWSMTTGEKLVGPLGHDGVVVAVRFSPTGDRIATATAKNPDDQSIRIYDSKNGEQLLDIPFGIFRHISSSLSWSADGHQLLAASYSEAKRFDTSSGILLRRWSVPGGGSCASIALSHNQKFIAVAAYRSLSFWDALTHKLIGPVIEHTSAVWSIALSPDDYCIATGEQSGKVTLRSLRDVLPDSYFTLDVSDHTSQSRRL